MRRVTENKKIIYISQYFPVFPTLRVLDRAVFPGKYRPGYTAPVFPGQHCTGRPCCVYSLLANHVTMFLFQCRLQVLLPQSLSHVSHVLPVRQPPLMLTQTLSSGTHFSLFIEFVFVKCQRLVPVQGAIFWIFPRLKVDFVFCIYWE